MQFFHLIHFVVLFRQQDYYGKVLDIFFEKRLDAEKGCVVQIFSLFKI